MSEPDDSGVGYDLLMPFVCVTSTGGPYDDMAFVAGARMAAINLGLTLLKSHGSLVEFTAQWYVEPALQAQLDLVAMHHGLTVTFEPCEEHADEWVLATFRYAAERMPTSG